MSKTDSADEARSITEQISQLRLQAEEQLKATELARKNADSEGLFAVNAKRACEEHATAISQLKGAAESAATAITANKQKSDELLAAVTAAKAALDAETKVIADGRKEIEQTLRAVQASSQTVGVRAQEAEASKAAADAALKNATEAVAAIEKARITAEAQTKGAQVHREAAGKIEAAIAEHLVSSTSDSEEIEKLLAGAKENEVALKAVLDHLAKSDAISTGHETRVKQLTEDLAQLIKRVDSILPGATSASLASSFNAQRTRFAEPQKRWLRTFVTCIIGLVVVALPSFLAATFGMDLFGHKPDSTTQEILRGLLLRLPILIPLVWLAIYAGRYYMLSLRLEEEYAYKEAVSRAFEGYKREMEKIEPTDLQNPAPLNKLCENILAAIAERPGRIYEGKHQDITVLSETQGIANEVTSLAKRRIEGER